MLHYCEYTKEVLGFTITNFRWSHFRFPNSELIKLLSVSWVVFNVCEDSRCYCEYHHHMGHEEWYPKFLLLTPSLKGL